MKVMTPQDVQLSRCGSSSTPTSLLLAAGLLALAGWSSLPADDADCLMCHDDPDFVETRPDGTEARLHVEVGLLEKSVHAGLSCLECHTTIDEELHPDGVYPPKVDCLSCHEEQSAIMGDGLHLRLTNGGVESTASCTDCHGAHDMTPVLDPASPVHYANLTFTCGKCHEDVATAVTESVHGQAILRGLREAPSCSDCHAEHGLGYLDPDALRRISEQACSRCHDSELLATRFGMPADRVSTFFDSYHGLAYRKDSARAANCASCHGVHDIRPSSDPKSMIHPANLAQTCGECHPGAGEKFIQGKIHQAPNGNGDLGSKVNLWIARIYTGVIILTIGLMAFHNGLAWRRKILPSLRRKDRVVIRMSPQLRIQHALLVVCFVYLALSGFALKYPDSWIGILFGSEEFRRGTHRWSGILMMLVGIYHILWVWFTRRGRRLMRDLAPTPKDARDLRDNLRWFLERSDQRPRFARFSYAEKLEYWAVVWGMLLMGTTGLAIWWKVPVTQFVPRWVIDASITVHFFEAILAVLAIIVWHFYHVIFDPDVYPANWSFWDGKVSRKWHEHEHPLDTDVETVEPEPNPSDGSESEALPSDRDSPGPDPGPRPEA